MEGHVCTTYTVRVFVAELPLGSVALYLIV